MVLPKQCSLPMRRRNWPAPQIHEPGQIHPSGIRDPPVLHEGPDGMGAFIFEFSEGDNLETTKHEPLCMGAGMAIGTDRLCS